MYDTGQFCHGYARGPWTAVAWWALYWNGPIRQTFLMVSVQIPAWNDAAKKYLGRENLSANIGKLSSESSCQKWPKYFAAIFLIRAAAGSVFLSRAKRSTLTAWLSLFFRLNFLPKRLSSMACCFFRAKTLVIRGMSFAGFSRKLPCSATSLLVFWHQKKLFWSAILFHCHPNE